MASNAAKSYIEAVMARADGATNCAACEGEGEVWADGLAHSQSYRGPSMPCPSCGGMSANRDIPTLAKIARRAIEALEVVDDPISRDALAEINAMAKGSQ